MRDARGVVGRWRWAHAATRKAVIVLPVRACDAKSDRAEGLRHQRTAIPLNTGQPMERSNEAKLVQTLSPSPSAVPRIWVTVVPAAPVTSSLRFFVITARRTRPSDPTPASLFLLATVFLVHHLVMEIRVGREGGLCQPPPYTFPPVHTQSFRCGGGFFKRTARQGKFCLRKSFSWHDEEKEGKGKK